ncbi:MAG: hypothetical protein QW379_00340 [Thermoplasmata archaeon]
MAPGIEPLTLLLQLRKRARKRERPLLMEAFADRLAARLSGRGMVVFDVREENLPSAHKIESATMYSVETKRPMAKLTYALLPDNKVEIQSFNIEDWSEKARAGQRLLRWFVRYIAARGVTTIAGGIYSTDTRTADKLDMFRAEGFEIKEMGSMAGHTEYQVLLEL